MVDIRPQDLNPAVTPIDADSPIIIDQGLAGVNRTTSNEMVNAVAPVASHPEAEVGTNDVKRMTALKTKQSIASEVGVSIASYAQGAKADSALQSVNGKTGNSVTLVKGDVGLSNVDNTSDANKPVSNATQTALNSKANSSVSISAGTGLTGGGTLAASRTLALNSTSIASLAKADTAVQPDIRIIAGTGLTGGGTLTANRTVALNAVSIASLGKADSAVQPSRQVIAGDNIDGGGTLENNITISLATNVDYGIL